MRGTPYLAAKIIHQKSMLSNISGEWNSSAVLSRRSKACSERILHFDLANARLVVPLAMIPKFSHELLSYHATIEQVQRGVSSGPVTSDSSSIKDAVPYRGMWDAMSRIYGAGGIAGLFRGSGARMAFHAPSTAIAMATFESAKEAWAFALDPTGDR